MDDRSLRRLRLKILIVRALCELYIVGVVTVLLIVSDTCS